MNRQFLEKVMGTAGFNDVPKYKIKALLEAYERVIRLELLEGNKVRISGLGTLVVRPRKGRTFRNLLGRGKDVTIPDYKTVRFVPFPAFREMMREAG